MFHSTTLLEFVEEHPELKTEITEDVYNPMDKMDQRCLMQACDPVIALPLTNHSNPRYRDMGISKLYLCVLSYFYRPPGKKIISEFISTIRVETVLSFTVTPSLIIFLNDS